MASVTLMASIHQPLGQENYIMYVIFSVQWLMTQFLLWVRGILLTTSMVCLVCLEVGYNLGFQTNAINQEKTVVMQYVMYTMD